MIQYLQISQAAYDAFMADDNRGPSLDKMVWQGRIQAGYWKTTGNTQVLNCSGTEQELDSLRWYFQPADVFGYWKWEFDGKVWYLAEYEGQHDDLLALQRDHVQYDENGDEISREPASFDNPNWAHDYSGSGQNVFARSVSREFGEDYA